LEKGREEEECNIVVGLVVIRQPTKPRSSRVSKLSEGGVLASIYPSSNSSNKKKTDTLPFCLSRRVQEEASSPS
jgi:hypothetical protein